MTNKIHRRFWFQITAYQKFRQKMLIWTLFKLLSAESASSREEFSSSTCGNIIQVQKVNRQFNGFYTKSEQKNNSTPVYTRLGSDTVLQYADNRWKFEGKF